MTEGIWSWPLWRNAPCWATHVAQDADGAIKWWMHPPLPAHRLQKWIYEPPNRAAIAMQGDPNSCWEYAIEKRHEGVKRELGETE